MCSSHADFDHALHSLEREQRMAAEAADREAEDARDELAQLGESWPQGWPEGVEHRHRGRIEDATNRATRHRRRADFAASGYLLATDAEHSDPAYMQKYQSLVGHAHRLGRAKTSMS